MKLVADKIRFEIGDTQIDLDIVEAQNRIEQICEMHADAEDTVTPVLDSVAEWFHDEFQVTLSPTQAHQVQSKITFAWEIYKKKLSGMLVLDSGIPLTPSGWTTHWSVRWINCFRPSWRKKKSKTDWDDLISQGIASGNL